MLYSYIIALFAPVVNIFVAKRTNFLYNDFRGDFNGVGIRIKTILRERNITIKKLSDLAGIPLNTLYSITKRDSERVDTVILQRLAVALEVSEEYLLGQGDKPTAPWDMALEQKLTHIGYSTDFAEGHEEYFLWINYPDGTLEVSEDELRTLNDSADSYLRFKLAELREAHKDQFRPKK